MGDVIDPKPPQWQHKNPPEDVPEDRVLMLTNALMEVLHHREIDSTVVQMAALRLVMKGVLGSYRAIVGHEVAKELMRQASAMSEQYEIKGIDDIPET